MCCGIGVQHGGGMETSFIHVLLLLLPFFSPLFSSSKHRAIDLQTQLHMEEPIKVKTLQSRLQNAHFVLTIVLLQQFASSSGDIAICFVKGELM